MRKLKLQMQISLDGFIAGPNGEMDWFVMNWDQRLKDQILELTDSTDLILLGRKLAEGFIPHWASHPEEEGAENINNKNKVVFTKTLAKSEWDRTVLAKGNLVEEVNQLKKQSGKDIIVYGGGGFVSALLKHQLIDELYLLVNPTVAGKGMSIFQQLEKVQALTLKKAEGFECGITLLKYEIVLS